MDRYNNPQPGKTYVSPRLDAFDLAGTRLAGTTLTPRNRRQ